jgi:hypothetical protein
METDMLDAVVEGAFELGKVLCKMQLSKGESAKMIRTLGGREQEVILLQKIGKFWNQQKWLDRPDGLVVVTNHRFVFLLKVESITTTTEFLSFPLESIAAAETTRVMWISPAVRFTVAGRVYMFTFFANAHSVLSTLRQAQSALTAVPHAGAA